MTVRDRLPPGLMARVIVALVLVVSLHGRERATPLPQPGTDGDCSCTSRSILEPEAPPEATKLHRQLGNLCGRERHLRVRAGCRVFVQRLGVAGCKAAVRA